MQTATRKEQLFAIALPPLQPTLNFGEEGKGSPIDVAFEREILFADAGMSVAQVQ